MISQVNAQAAVLYQDANKNVQKNSSVTKQGDTSRIDQIKAEIGRGEYRVDLKALAEKIADELM